MKRVHIGEGFLALRADLLAKGGRFDNIPFGSSTLLYGVASLDDGAFYAAPGHEKRRSRRETP